MNKRSQILRSSQPELLTYVGAAFAVYFGFITVMRSLLRIEVGFMGPKLFDLSVGFLHHDFYLLPTIAIAVFVFVGAHASTKARLIAFALLVAVSMAANMG